MYMYMNREKKLGVGQEDSAGDGYCDAGMRPARRRDKADARSLTNTRADQLSSMAEVARSLVCAVAVKHEESRIRKSMKASAHAAAIMFLLWPKPRVIRKLLAVS
jgi:hypothetical protein